MEMAVRSESSMRPKISLTDAGHKDYTGTVATTAMVHLLTGVESCWCLQSTLMEKSMAFLKLFGIWA